MQKKIIWTAAALAMIALASTWGFPGVSRGEDFLEKLKKAAEQAAQERQKQRQQQQQQQAGQQRQPQTSQQPQAQQPAQPQPRYKPGGGTKLLPNVKPQPSPDFGTPEGTAKIAAKAGFLEVVGIKLGMPVKDAVGALKSHNGGFKSGPITLREYEALPGVVMTPVLYAPNPAGPNATSGDDFNLLITYAPNEAFVWGIVRNMGFGTNATRPPLENTLAGLRQKYGPESTQQVNCRLIWIYDANGQQVMGATSDGYLQSVLPDLDGRPGGIHRRQQSGPQQSILQLILRPAAEGRILLRNRRDGVPRRSVPHAFSGGRLLYPCDSGRISGGFGDQYDDGCVQPTVGGERCDGVAYPFDGWGGQTEREAGRRRRKSAAE